MKNNKNNIEKNKKILNQIENTRAKNNINWMSILRIAMNNSPKETVAVLKKINQSDDKISKLLKKIK